MSGGNWPNPERIGFPLNPEKEGYHWLSRLDGSDLFIGDWRIEEFETNNNYYWMFADCHEETESVGKRLKYHGPCLFPEEINALEARVRSELSQALEDADRFRWIAKTHTPECVEYVNLSDFRVYIDGLRAGEAIRAGNIKFTDGVKFEFFNASKDEDAP